MIRLPERYIVGDTPTNLEASVTIDLLGQSERTIDMTINRRKTKTTTRIYMPVAAVRFKVEASLAIAEIEVPDLRRTLVKLLIRQLEPLAQNLDLYLVSQIQRIAERLACTWSWCFSCLEGLDRSRPSGRYAAPAAMVTVPLLAKIPPPWRQQSP
ncbi:hypothetical protein AC629_01950 [Bradyrhizobium sp. NAS80.1]|nr:hypothetical protein AC629_01950 [Bradyrhizobium sp. NAS80.1]